MYKVRATHIHFLELGKTNLIYDIAGSGCDQPVDAVQAFLDGYARRV